MRPRWAVSNPLLQEYFDTEWGRPIRDEHSLFERLSLEGFQAGLSWLTILKKRPAIRAAFAYFDPDTVAGFTDTDVEQLIQTVELILNRQKSQDVIMKASATLQQQN